MFSFVLVLFYRSVVTQLAAPKIPEGERVDFDVCSLRTVAHQNNDIKLNRK